jgi:hypothetical protein
VRKILLIGVFANFATSYAHPMLGRATVYNIHPAQDIRSGQENAGRVGTARVAQGLGLDNALTGRKPSCINNDLRSECATVPPAIQSGTKHVFYIDWNGSARRCSIVVGQPITSHVIGGGPFYSRSDALAAIKKTPGC